MIIILIIKNIYILAMELVPLIVDLLIETSIYRVCPIAMFDCRRVKYRLINFTKIKTWERNFPEGCADDVSVDLIHFVKKVFHAKRGKIYYNVRPPSYKLVYKPQ